MLLVSIRKNFPAYSKIQILDVNKCNVNKIFDPTF